ncbi:hypothetical protein SBRY_50781 [Actinacidiphila bryophytorum]|uniref:Uncharacterized protein n=1 Tax=Actinacidiphila bryophytorum TaxID=1436133 RepID=A0A9W4H5E4_9ACTN|nr:hypothetical protein SBRY_50781 [Actinacidiphila bryophytorum]
MSRARACARASARAVTARHRRHRPDLNLSGMRIRRRAPGYGPIRLTVRR